MRLFECVLENLEREGLSSEGRAISRTIAWKSVWFRCFIVTAGIEAFMSSFECVDECHKGVEFLAYPPATGPSLNEDSARRVVHVDF